MGGGTMIRGVARLMGAAVAAVAPSSSVPLCQVSTSSLDRHLNVSSSTNLLQKDSLNTAPFKSLVDIQHMETDDWERPFDDDLSAYSRRSHLVFAPTPSEEEVEEATNELHAALRLSIPAPVPVPIEGDHCQVVHNDQHFDSTQGTLVEERDTNTQISLLPVGAGLLAAGSGSVYQAFQLLQTNSKVQDAVKSLARDPAIWRAVLSNEKVLELTQSLQDTSETAQITPPSKDDREELDILNFTTKVCDFVTGKVLQVLDKVVEIVGSILTSVEKTFFSKDTVGSVDRTVTSCMMLAVAVLLIVVVKRASV